jgi:hypothetical protein
MPVIFSGREGVEVAADPDAESLMVDATGKRWGKDRMVLSYWAVWGIGRVVGIFYIFMGKPS